VRLAKRHIRHGADAQAVHQQVLALFDARGYTSGLRNGRQQGFFHGTGHGLGLEIHEAPSIGRRPGELHDGHVVTVEPGLYYLGLGGVRIEDVVRVTRDGNRTLTRAPKGLEI